MMRTVLRAEFKEGRGRDSIWACSTERRTSALRHTAPETRLERRQSVLFRLKMSTTYCSEHDRVVALARSCFETRGGVHESDRREGQHGYDRQEEQHGDLGGRPRRRADEDQERRMV